METPQPKTPEQRAALLNLDERAVLLCRPGSFLPRHLGRAAWSLRLYDFVLLDGRPWRMTLTEVGRAVRAALGHLIDEETGWGIQLVGRGEDCWWKPDNNGYTLDVSRAGLYSREHAASTHGMRYAGGDGPRDVAVPPARMRELMDTALAKARDGVTRLEQARDAVSAVGAP